MMIINKSKAVGLTEEELIKDNSMLGFQFLSVMYYIMESWKEEKPITEGELKRMNPAERGLVKKAYNAMYHDMHGLAVLVDMIKVIHQSKAYGTRHKDFLYVLELVEKYFANLRSIYDFLAKVLKLAIDPRDLGKMNFDSFSKLINKIEDGSTKGKLPEKAEEAILRSKNSFIHIRDIRDDVLHNGFQLDAPMTKDDGYYINVKNANGDMEEHHLLTYLSGLTFDMFAVADELSEVIREEYFKRYGTIPMRYVALVGVCIPSFIEFLSYAAKE